MSLLSLISGILMADISVLLASGLSDFYCLNSLLIHFIPWDFNFVFLEKFHKPFPYGNILTICNYMIRFHELTIKFPHTIRFPLSYRILNPLPQNIN